MIIIIFFLFPKFSQPLTNICNDCSLFSATKHDADIAMRASKAYKNIVDALLDAQQALNDANDVINLISDRVSTRFHLFFMFSTHVGYYL